jgi:hypothetical protein
MYRRALALVALAFVAAGCSPGSDPESITAFDTVTTLFSSQADFAGAQTFTVVDSVMHLGEPPDDISRAYDALILSRIRADLSAIGWTEIANPGPGNNPDVAVQTAVTTSEYSGVVYWPPYWGWYPGWGYPGYGWGWGGWATAYSYTTGTVLMAMLDLRNPNIGSQTIPVMWLGALNGVLGNTASSQARITNGIDQAFEQSPYLEK